MKTLKTVIAIAGAFGAVVTMIKIAEWAEDPTRRNFRRLFGV